MITSLDIENLRGVESGRIDGLAALTILTGPNGSGKSTVLDAMLIAASPSPAEAVGRAIHRHPVSTGGARWLFSLESAKARVQAVTTEATWERRLELFEHPDEALQEELMKRGSPPEYSMIHVAENELRDEAISAWTVLGSDNQYVTKSTRQGGLSTLPFIRLVDPGLPIPLHRTWSAVIREGRRDLVHNLLVDLIEGFERLEIIALTEQDFALAVTKDGTAVPLSLSGDGIQAFTQLALETAVAPGGLVLIEEPEVYQHPRAIWQTAKALLANMRRGVQIILTTHSLELIDAILAEVDSDIDQLALINLGLHHGELRTDLRRGEEIQFSRSTLENDLR